MTVGERIKTLRKEQGLTQQGLADILNIPKNSIVNYELNRKNPNFDAIIKLENYFHVSAAYLKGEQDDLYDRLPALRLLIQEMEHLSNDEILYILEHVKIYKNFIQRKTDSKKRK